MEEPRKLIIQLNGFRIGFAYFDVEKEFEEKNKDLRRQDLDNLKEWLKFQPHLPKILDPQLLFLHSCYYNNEITKQVIDNFFTFRSHIPEIFSKRDVDALLKYADVFFISALTTSKLCTHLCRKKFTKRICWERPHSIGDAWYFLEDLISESLKEYILERLDFFDLESRQVLDESKRPGKPRN